MNGVIIVDKPAGFTSHDVVNRMRRILGQKSVGHLGTLDPLATGVLPLVTGGLTRLAQFYTTSEKSYEGTIRFGFATNTYDADGEPAGEVHQVTLSLEHLQQLASRFQGVIEQVPPPFSAKKIHGVPAYKLARKQQEVILKPVQVEIKEFAILSVDAERATFRARVASGTYMRSVAHELGQLQGSGAHLESLRRTAVAEFDIAQAHTLEEIEGQMMKKQIKEGEVEEEQMKRKEDHLRDCHSELGRRPGEEPAVRSHEALFALFIHPRQLLPKFPSVTADEATVARIRNGRPINLPELSRARQVKVFSGQSDLIAIATRVAGTLFHPKIVLVAETCGTDTRVRRL
ncbi:MAG TPA: tRNA pseudouridine(55) synthase TruB [Candidatus Dormibacteraeota bacterium]|nr:tRNA pseudouridine(55) synthase TruB [Candidatus Dormibacteraeota bacterium]